MPAARQDTVTACDLAPVREEMAELRRWGFPPRPGTDAAAVSPAFSSDGEVQSPRLHEPLIITAQHSDRFAVCVGLKH